MLLAIDIGNTNITFALMDKKGRIIRRHSTPTEKPNLRPLLGRSRRKIDNIIIVSVVSSATGRIKRDLKRKLKGAKISVVGKDIPVPLKCAYNKRQVGQDRLITALAAKMLYGLPVLIVDFGTAVTFDTVSKRGVYEGGLILPGIKMSLESLSERTEMLPKTYLRKTTSFIGKDTVSSIRNGMIYGYASLSEGLIKLFRKKISKNIKVVATGGDAPLISRYTKTMKRVDTDLSLKGLYFLSNTKKP